MKSAQAHQTQPNEPNSESKKPDLGVSPKLPQGKSNEKNEDRELDEDTFVRGRKQNVENEVHVTRERSVSTPASRQPLEAILAISLKRLLMWGVALSLGMFLVPAPAVGDSLLFYNLAHLTVLQIATYALVIELTPLTDRPWFASTKRSWLASVVSLIAVVVGFSALLTLATSAVARYDVSLQFLQLLSSMDIAWVVAALYIGARKLWGNGTAAVLGSIILAACVASIALYLQTVGFTESGGWLVDSEAMYRIVISSDTVAAILSLTVLLAAVRSVQRTEQAKPHS